MYSAYVLTDASRAKLLAKFPPQYDRVIAHHVTFTFPDTRPPPEVDEVQVVGYADSGDGLQALVVSVNGETARPDGSTYHITWSIDPASDYTPKDSNALLAKKRYTLIIPVPFEAAAVVLN